VFIYDISRQAPVKTQVVEIANSYTGLSSIHPARAFYVAGGPSDNVHIFTRNGAGTGGRRKVRRWPWATTAWALALT